MALEGNAKDFGLSEIFQLISIQKKSGMLSISAADSMAVFFREGKIISTRDRRTRTRDPLKDYLLRYGFIGRDEMNNLQQIQAGSNMDLTEILISEKYFSEDELRQIFAEQIYESVQEILSWPKSHYKFISGSNVLTGVSSYASIKVEAILMESMRRIDEFPEMRRIFSSEDMLLKRLVMPQDSKVELERSEEFLYELLEQERSLHYLISHSRMARFSTYESLKQLLEKGLLEITADPLIVEDKREKETTSRKKKREKKKIAPTLVTALLLIACFAVGEYAVPRLLSPGWTADSFSRGESPPAGREGVLAEDLETLKLRQLESSIREGLEEYMAAHGSYPYTLEILVVKRFVDNDIVKRAQESGLLYRMGGEGSYYTLSGQ